MEGYDYQAAASTIKIDDIASDDVNRKILRRLKANDPQFDDLRVSNGDRCDENYYCPEGVRGTGWLGYYIGQNTILRELRLYSNQFHWFNSNVIEPFCRGVKGNINSENCVQWIRSDGGRNFPITASIF